jgi:hypothetical protein
MCQKIKAALESLIVQRIINNPRCVSGTRPGERRGPAGRVLASYSSRVAAGAGSNAREIE